MAKTATAPKAAPKQAVTPSATETLTPSPKGAVKRSNSLSDLADMTGQPKFHYVTGIHLRRSVLYGDIVHNRLVLSEEHYRSITAAGVKLGITWDEVVRGLIEKENFMPHPFADLDKFIPHP